MGYTRPTDSTSSSERARSIRVVLWWILFLNIGVALAKLVWGLVTHSAAMQADGFHSMFDGTGNVVGLVGMSFASRPADRDHPYGHGKYETYASAVIAGMLVLAAYRVGSSAISALLSGAGHTRVDAISFAVMIGTLIVNVVITTWERRAGEKLGAEILIADASHTRSDIFVSLGVIISLVLVRMGFARADGAVALLVAAAIVHTAWGVLKQVSATLSDSIRIPADDIRAVVLGVAGVLGAHGIRTRGSEAAVYVDLHVQVDQTLSVSEGHHIAEEVERVVGEAFPQVADVIAHLEPYDEYQAAKTTRERESNA